MFPAGTGCEFFSGVTMRHASVAATDARQRDDQAHPFLRGRPERVLH